MNLMQPHFLQTMSLSQHQFIPPQYANPSSSTPLMAWNPYLPHHPNFQNLPGLQPLPRHMMTPSFPDPSLFMPSHIHDPQPLPSPPSPALPQLTRLVIPARQFSCSKCGKIFHQESTLTRHLRFHSSGKPYICTDPDCQQAFKDRSNLKRHILRHHTNERRYPCLVCDKRFKTNSDLCMHRKHSHRNDYPITPMEEKKLARDAAIALKTAQFHQKSTVHILVDPIVLKFAYLWSQESRRL